MYRESEIIKDCTPFPRPSKAPEEVMETEDTKNPILMIRRAVFPASIVSGFVVNNQIKTSGIIKQISVPASIIPALIRRTIL